jgi:hypothetical protein
MFLLQVLVLKETIVFITPRQPNMETIMNNVTLTHTDQTNIGLFQGWTIKLVGVRVSDGTMSKTQFNFDYVPEDYYDPCFFCELTPDGLSSTAVMPRLVGPARPGVKKRRMPDQKSTIPSPAKVVPLLLKLVSYLT